MIFGQIFECRSEILQLVSRRSDSQQAAIVLHHVNPGASVGGVNHELHRALWLQDITEGTQTNLWIRLVVQHSRADDLIEGFPQLPNIQKGKLSEFEVV